MTGLSRKANSGLRGPGGPLKRRVKAVEASSLEPLCHVLRRESDKACPRLTVNRRVDPAYDACRERRYSGPWRH